MTCTEAESSELLDGHIVALSRGSQLRVRLEDGREIRDIPLLEALEEAAGPGALIVNRPVQVRMYKHPKLPRIVWIGRPEQYVFISCWAYKWLSHAGHMHQSMSCPGHGSGIRPWH